MLLNTSYSFRQLKLLIFSSLVCQFFANAFPTDSASQRYARVAGSSSDIVEHVAGNEIVDVQAKHQSSSRIEVAPSMRRGLAAEDLGNGWEVIYEYFDTLLPNVMVSPVLSKFYGDIMIKIMDLADTDPLTSFFLSQGLFQLEFWSPTGEPIPWQVVYRFASNLLTMTGMGFTSLYDAVYWHNPSGTKIVVKLTLVLDALMQLSSGESGESSGS